MPRVTKLEERVAKKLPKSPEEVRADKNSRVLDILQRLGAEEPSLEEAIPEEEQPIYLSPTEEARRKRLQQKALV